MTAGTAVGTAPWTGREPSAAMPPVDGRKSMNAPFSTRCLGGSGTGSFPLDLICPQPRGFGGRGGGAGRGL